MFKNHKITGRFKFYKYLVVINKDIYQMPHCPHKRTKVFRKLKYYPKRDAYNYNGQYLTKKRLLKLYYPVNETSEDVCQSLNASGILLQNFQNQITLYKQSL